MKNDNNVVDRAVTLFGIPVQSVTMKQVLEDVHQVIKENKYLDIGVVNAAKVVNMYRNDELYEAVMSSDVIYADGAAVVWASKLIRRPLPERVAGIDLMWELLKQGNDHHYRVFLFGAKEAVSQKVEQIIKETFPNVVIAGRLNGYYEECDEPKIAETIAAANADLLFVAMTSPKKEKFMAKWSDTIKVHVVHGVGGSFDVVSGEVERAPERWQKLGLEWLYRVKQEPGRLWKRYLITNTLFIWMLMKEMFGFRKKPIK